MRAGVQKCTSASLSCGYEESPVCSYILYYGMSRCFVMCYKFCFNFTGSTWFEDIGWGWSHTFSLSSRKSSAVYNRVVYWYNYYEVSLTSSLCVVLLHCICILIYRN